MPNIVKDIQFLSYFLRFTSVVRKELKASGNPLLLTDKKGRPVLVVQDAAAYQRLLELAEKAEMMEFLREAQADADDGRTVSAREFLESLGQKKNAKKA